jgi:hypothetical protein
MGRTQRVMLVRAGGQGYGFSVRGGAEHRLGIFVSEVERGSEAHLQGLQVCTFCTTLSRIAGSLAGSRAAGRIRIGKRLLLCHFLPSRYRWGTRS